MDCWICKTTALGTCRFCGRGICGDHAKFMPFILEVYHPRTKEHVQALVVEDALYCGVCRPRPQPVPMEELD